MGGSEVVLEGSGRCKGDREGVEWGFRVDKSGVNREISGLRNHCDNQ